MENIKIVREFSSRSDMVIPIIPIGDIHRGSAGLIEKLLYKAIDKAKELNAIVIGMGDYGECITRSDARQDLSSFDYRYLTPDKQYEQSSIDLEPIKNQIIGILQGNHEQKAWMVHDHNYGDWLAKELSIPFCPDFLYARIIFKRNCKDDAASRAFNLLAHHGYTNARTDGYKIKVIQDMANIVAGQNSPHVFLMGHVHKLGEALPTNYLWVDNNMKTREFIQHFYFTGSYVKNYEPEQGTVMMGKYTSYAAQKGYPPTMVGCPIIWVKPNRVDADHLSTRPPFSVRYSTLDWEPNGDEDEF